MVAEAPHARAVCILLHARARERVVPISELVFGTLTQNRSSLSLLWDLPRLPARRIMDYARYVKAPEEWDDVSLCLASWRICHTGRFHLCLTRAQFADE